MGIKNRVTKYDLYEIISDREELSQFLPPAQIFEDFEQFMEFIERYEKIVLKPQNISEKNICIIEKLGDNFRVTDCRRKKKIKSILTSEVDLESYLNKLEENYKNYILQKYIKLAKVEEDLFDLRFVMKKITQGDWNLKGIEYSVAGNNFVFTNVLNRNFKFHLKEAVKSYYPLHFDLNETMNKANRLCLKACKAIEEASNYSEELGFDIGIDEENKLWLVEINIFDSFKKFSVVDYKTYLSVDYTPLLYTVSAYNFNNK
ncbi:YheC/YheD family protein [Clostridium sp. YIM B02515]|uniref:YheC/YheD family protein n=1 Tax=Clostridium rhizosphaerae TaxID=2803861 RepID=A0ABS1TBT6_9CLOT|nr:YheC/YheD family protein [Clostridium rhizosphaerae]MBL4936826.1 YheC/YheD family protein [Clostridium rhizosphaerae]